MGPSELIISGILTTALVAPASLLIESAHAPGFSKYVMRDDCKVGQIVTTCIVNSETGEQLGI